MNIKDPRDLVTAIVLVVVALIMIWIGPRVDGWLGAQVINTPSTNDSTTAAEDLSAAQFLEEFLADERARALGDVPRLEERLEWEDITTKIQRWHAKNTSWQADWLTIAEEADTTQAELLADIEAYAKRHEEDLEPVIEDLIAETQEICENQNSKIDCGL